MSSILLTSGSPEDVVLSVIAKGESQRLTRRSVSKVMEEKEEKEFIKSLGSDLVEGVTMISQSWVDGVNDPLRMPATMAEMLQWGKMLKFLRKDSEIWDTLDAARQTLFAKVELFVLTSIDINNLNVMWRVQENARKYGWPGTRSQLVTGILSVHKVVVPEVDWSQFGKTFFAEWSKITKGKIPDDLEFLEEVELKRRKVLQRGFKIASEAQLKRENEQREARKEKKEDLEIAQEQVVYSMREEVEKEKKVTVEEVVPRVVPGEDILVDTAEPIRLELPNLCGIPGISTEHSGAVRSILWDNSHIVDPNIPGYMLATTQIIRQIRDKPSSNIERILYESARVDLMCGEICPISSQEMNAILLLDDMYVKIPCPIEWIDKKFIILSQKNCGALGIEGAFLLGEVSDAARIGPSMIFKLSRAWAFNRNDLFPCNLPMLVTPSYNLGFYHLTSLAKRGKTPMDFRRDYLTTNRFDIAHGFFDSPPECKCELCLLSGSFKIKASFFEDNKENPLPYPDTIVQDMVNIPPEFGPAFSSSSELPKECPKRWSLAQHIVSCNNIGDKVEIVMRDSDFVYFVYQIEPYINHWLSEKLTLDVSIAPPVAVNNLKLQKQLKCFDCVESAGFEFWKHQLLCELYGDSGSVKITVLGKNKKRNKNCAYNALCAIIMGIG